MKHSVLPYHGITIGWLIKLEFRDLVDDTGARRDARQNSLSECSTFTLLPTCVQSCGSTGRM
jgi:hypothetical protein